jgi:hypothetical protein
MRMTTEFRGLRVLPGTISVLCILITRRSSPVVEAL